MSLTSEVTIRRVPRDEQVNALWYLFAAEPESARRERVTAAVRAATKGTLHFELLLEARRGERRVGVIWGQELPGRNANVWTALVESGEPESTYDLLQAALDESLAKAGLAMAQALLPVSAAAAASCLRRNGYVNVANLVYLVCGTDSFPKILPASELTFRAFGDDSRRLAAIIEATYVGTQDAPEMDGMRDTRDVIEGYKATGQFDPGRWWFVQYGEHDVGCVLLTEHPDLRIWELVYMGLVPSARGKGWGTELVQFAQWQALRAGCSSLLVSVDAANTPAVAAYSRCGFLEVDRRQVWLKKFPTHR